MTSAEQNAGPVLEHADTVNRSITSFRAQDEGLHKIERIRVENVTIFVAKSCALEILSLPCQRDFTASASGRMNREPG